ncbi:hypothetical protein F4775DRAFT_403915 [Biscogniauxia sp. FL1348]|nr:hypothetical protein F4775DRAFT_403915 [Biscogniauxia sp. FL1348]
MTAPLFSFSLRLRMLQRHNMHMRNIPSRPKHDFLQVVSAMSVVKKTPRSIPISQQLTTSSLLSFLLSFIVPGGFSFPPPFHFPNSPPPLSRFPPLLGPGTNMFFFFCLFFFYFFSFFFILRVRQEMSSGLHVEGEILRDWFAASSLRLPPSPMSCRRRAWKTGSRNRKYDCSLTFESHMTITHSNQYLESLEFGEMCGSPPSF